MTNTKCKLVVTTFQSRREWIEEEDIVSSILFVMFCFLSRVLSLWEFIIFSVYFCVTELSRNNKKFKKGVASGNH